MRLHVLPRPHGEGLQRAFRCQYKCMRFILYLILFFLLYAIARAFLFPKKVIRQKRGNPDVAGEEMVFDPVCQSYFPKNAAFNTKNGNETVYFCSEECREKFLKKT